MPGIPLAAGFNLTCQTLDSVTLFERHTFAPGEAMAISYSIEVPPEAADKEINIKLSARVRLGGITVPFALDEFKLSFPNQNFVPARPEEESPLPVSGQGSEVVNIEIPNDFPLGSATLRAKATIEAVGKRTCELDVEIAAPPAP